MKDPIWKGVCGLALLGAVAFTAYGGAGIFITGPGVALANELCANHGGLTQISASRQVSDIKCGDGLVLSTNLNLVHEKVFPKKG